MAGPIIWGGHNKICQILFVAGSTIVNCCYTDLTFVWTLFYETGIYQF